MNTAHLSSTKNTSPLAAFADQQIDWNLTPEMAVTLYLEWGNNDWRSEHPPVRSKSDVATYFVVDAWQDPLKVRLVRRNSESADDLVTVPLPEPLVKAFRDEYGSLKGVFEPLPVIKDWLKKELGQAYSVREECGNSDVRLAACPWESPLTPAVSSILPFFSIKKVSPFSGAVCSGARVAHRYASEAPKGINARGGFVLEGRW